MFYKRHISNVIERQQKKKSTLIITGARQVGKSTNLRNLLLDKGAGYITLDSPVLRTAALENPTAFLAENPAPVIIDEIQKVPSLFEYVKIAVDTRDEAGQYYLTGSHGFDLMRGVTESLAGRAGIIKMLGLSRRELNGVEYPEAFIPTKAHFDEMKKYGVPYDYGNIIQIIHKGSFPELYKTETDLKDWRDYYASYLQSYLEKDVREFINAVNMSAFIKFIRAAAALSGELLNYVSLAGLCGMTVNTVKQWLSVLEMSGLVYLLQPYYNNLNKRLLKTPKLYFLDTGLVCFLGGWNTPEQLISGARWGHIFETYAISEVLKSYYNDGNIYPPLHYYRDKEKNEIDLIIEEGGKLYPVEIKTTTDPDNRMAAAFGVLNKIPNKTVAPGAVICLIKDALPIGKNLWTAPVDMI